MTDERAYGSHETALRRLERTAARSLKPILAPSNYFQPKTRENWKTIDVLGHRLELKDNKTLYPKARAKTAFFDVAKGMCKFADIPQRHSWECVYQSTKAALEGLINDGKEFTGADWIRSALDRLAAEYREFRFWHLIEGLDLADMETLELGEVVVERLRLGDLGDPVNDRWITGDQRIIERWDGKLVLSAIARGDRKKAEEQFGEMCEIGLSILRFLVCASYVRGYSQSEVAISLAMHAAPGGGPHISMDVSDRSLTYAVKYRRPDARIDQSLLDGLARDNRLGNLINAIWAHQPTEIELTLRSSIYWIGQAQNESNLPSSFIKYWTALECFFSLDKDHVTAQLATSIATLCRRFGAVGFSALSSKDAYAQVVRLYRLRSRVLHRGSHSSLEQTDVERIAEICVAIVFIVLAARQQGLTKLRELRFAIQRFGGSFAA